MYILLLNSRAKFLTYKNQTFSTHNMCTIQTHQLNLFELCKKNSPNQLYKFISTEIGTFSLLEIPLYLETKHSTVHKLRYILHSKFNAKKKFRYFAKFETSFFHLIVWYNAQVPSYNTCFAQIFIVFPIFHSNSIGTYFSKIHLLLTFSFLTAEWFNQIPRSKDLQTIQGSIGKSVILRRRSLEIWIWISAM